MLSVSEGQLLGRTTPNKQSLSLAFQLWNWMANSAWQDRLGWALSWRQESLHTWSILPIKESPEWNWHYHSHLAMCLSFINQNPEGKESGCVNIWAPALPNTPHSQKALKETLSHLGSSCVQIYQELWRFPGSTPAPAGKDRDLAQHLPPGWGRPS